MCRKGHPCLNEPINKEVLQKYEHTLLMLEGQNLSGLRQRVQDLFPERQVSFSSYNMFTIAALIGNSDLLGLMPTRLFSLFNRCWPLEEIDFPPLSSERIDISLYYNKLSMRDPVLESVIDVIRRAF